MPSHVTNILAVQGDETACRNILQAICAKDDPEQVICFDRILPMPKSLDIRRSDRLPDGIALVLTAMDPDSACTLKGVRKLQPDAFSRLRRSLARTTGYSRPLSLEEIGYLHAQTDLAEYVLLGKTALQNLQQYGATDWYDWRLQHWGTR